MGRLADINRSVCLHFRGATAKELPSASEPLPDMGMSLVGPKPTHGIVLLATLRQLPGATWEMVQATYGRVTLILALGLGTSFILSFFEDAFQIRYLILTPGTGWHIFADYVSWWGKLDHGLSVILLGWLVLAIYGKRARSQIAVLTLLWGQLVAGILVNIGKSGLGRARPNRGVADGFYGPTLDYTYQSFPSGHTTAAFAIAVAFLVLRPKAWPLALLYAGLVGWSRLALHVHHPSDVLMGAILGSVCGWLCGQAGLATERKIGTLTR